MGANPFLSGKTDDEVEKLVEDAAAAASSEADATEESPEGDEVDEFLKEEEADEALLDEDEDDFLGEDEDEGVEGVEGDVVDEGDGKKPKGDWVPIARLNKELKKRTELNNLIEGFKPLADVVTESYKDFKDPVNQLRYDAQFMSALEEVSKHDVPGFAQAIGAVTHFMKTGEMPKMGDTKTAEKPATKVIERDARVDAIVEREASRTIESVLPATMRASFKAVASDYIVANADNLAELNAAEVKSLTKQFIAEKGFTKEDIYGGKPSEKSAKVPTGTGKTRPAVGSTKSAAKKGEERKAPKTVDEWEAGHNERLASFSADHGF